MGRGLGTPMCLRGIIWGEERKESEDGSLYDVDLTGRDHAMVSVLSGPTFTEEFYDRSLDPDQESSDINNAMQVLLGALAYSELMDCNEDPSRANMWRDVRIDISNMASSFVDAYQEDLSDGGDDQ